MHICFASLDYPDKTCGGGVGTYVQTMGQELVRQGHKVSVITLANTRKPYYTEDRGVQIYWIDSGNLHWYISRIPFLGRIFSLPLRELEYSWAVLKAIKKIDKISPTDIVEGTETGTFGFVFLKPKIRTVIRLHGEAYSFAKFTPPGKIPIEIRLSRYLQRRAIRKAHCLTAPSGFQAMEIESEVGLTPGTVKVVTNPLRSERFEEEIRSVQPDNPRFLFVGRIEKRKGVLELLKAVPKVAERLPSAKFFLAGDFHPTISEKEIERLISDLGISDRVVFLGHLQKEDIYEYYRRATAVVMPSFYETFGYIYLEGLMHGKPVIAFDTDTAGKFVIHCKNGFLVPKGDVEALAEACVKSVSMTLELPDRSKLEEFNVGRVCGKMLALYEQLISDSPRIQESSIDYNIVISPHFDDAVFSCGGIMNEYSKQGKNNLVVTLFGGWPDNSALSPFAREIHNKWRLADPVSIRMDEDRKALGAIGAQEIHLDFLDCIYRKTEEGTPLYDNYESIKGALHPQDRGLSDDIYERVKEIVQRYDPGRAQILVPLGIGTHVDHQIARKVGLRLIDEGFRVFFYEEFPYSLWYPEQIKAIGEGHDGLLAPLVVYIEIKAKLKMIKHYKSQLSGIGGKYRKASRNFKKCALSIGSGTYAERIWDPASLYKDKNHLGHLH